MAITISRVVRCSRQASGRALATTTRTPKRGSTIAENANISGAATSVAAGREACVAWSASEVEIEAL